MLIRLVVAFFVVVAALPARAQAPVDKYFSERDAAIARFTPENVPKLEKPQLDAEEKARLALDRQLFAIIGTTAPKGFGPAKSNISTLFTGDMGFGTLDGLVFEANGGRTQMIVTTLPILQRWLKDKEELPKDVDQAIVGAPFFMQSVSTDAAILQYAEIPIATPRTFAMLAGRTQDRAPDDANEVFVVAIRGDRVFVAHGAIKQPIKASACTKARQLADKKLDAINEKEFKPGEDNSDFVDRLSKLRDQVDSDFQKCFAQNASKDPRFPAAVARVKELLDHMPAN